MTFDINAFVGDSVRTKTVRVLPPALAHLRNELDDLVEAMDNAELVDASRLDQAITETSALAEAAVAVDAKRRKIEAAQQPFVVKRIGMRAWSNLIAAHPPTKLHAKDRPGIDHNPDTFPVAAVAACSHDPQLSVADVEKLRDSLDVVEWETLFAAVVEVNRGGVEDPKVRVAGRIARMSAESGPTASPEGFPAASS